LWRLAKRLIGSPIVAAVTEDHLGVQLAGPMIDLAVPPRLTVTERGRRRRAGVLGATVAFAVVIAGGTGYAVFRPAAPAARGEAAPAVRGEAAPAGRNTAGVPAVPPAGAPETTFVRRPRPVAEPSRRRRR